MSIASARKDLETELIWMKGQVSRIESVLALLDNGHQHRSPARRKYKHTAATRRKIAAAQRKRFAALKK